MTINRLKLKVLLPSVLLKSIFLGQLMAVIMSARWSPLLVNIHTICDLYHNYPHSASFSLHVHGFIFISSPIKVPACVHLDWILRSGGEGGPQPSCISSTHAKVCLSLVFFHFSCCCNFLSLSPPWYLLNPMNFLFQLFELGNIDARGELVIATMTISKPSWENAWPMTKQLHHRKDLKSWLQPSLPTNQLTVENWQVGIGSAFKKRGVKYLCCSILDTQVGYF